MKKKKRTRPRADDKLRLDALPNHCHHTDARILFSTAQLDSDKPSRSLTDLATCGNMARLQPSSGRRTWVIFNGRRTG